MAAEAYHASVGLSNSQLSDLAKSPAHFYALHLEPTRPERKPTAAMSAGTLLHCAVLEPAALAQRYIVKPHGMSLSTTAGRAWATEQAQSGLIVISEDDMATANAQKAALLAVPELAAILSDGEAELSVFWEDADTQIMCRCRPDFTHKTGAKSVILLDLKTTSDPSPAEFSRSIHRFGYHRQAAHYTAGFEAATGLRVEAFVFGAVSSSYPFIAAPYVLDDETFAQGAEEVDDLKATYSRCMASGVWPAFGSGYQLIGLPAWARQSQEIEVAYA